MNILITGGTGSLGKVLVQKILTNPEVKRIVIYSRDELKQWEMQNQFKDSRLRFFIGDIRDKERLNQAMNGIDYVFHTAAMKQIVTCEYNPWESVKTNIIGSQNIIDSAIQNKVSKVIALSTDKAVDPVNHYGATKKTAEGLFVEANVSGNKTTKFSCVRYGNVLASRGSVIQLFKDQMTNNLPITITDKDMTRFWWTIEDAADFVIKCLDLTEGGEIFIPKLKASTIVQLAKIVSPDSQIKIIGIRPGEKLHEILISQHEIYRTFDVKDAFVIYPDFQFFSFPKYDKSKPVNKDFNYTSDSIYLQMDFDELKTLIDRI